MSLQNDINRRMTDGQNTQLLSVYPAGSQNPGPNTSALKLEMTEAGLAESSF